MFTRIITACTLACTLATAPAMAQKDDGSIGFSWGEVYKLPKGHDDLGFIGNGEEGYMQIGHDPHKSLSLQKFSPDMKLKDEKIIDLDKMPKDYTSEQFITVGKKHYWLFSTFEDEKEKLYVQEVSLKNNDFVGSAKEINSTGRLTGEMGGESFFSMKIINKYSYSFSGDGSKMLVQYRKKPEQKNDKISHDKIGFLVLDADMHPIWSREIRMPYTEEKMDNEDYQVDNNGNVYTLAAVYSGTKVDKKNPVYHFELLKWSNNNQEVTKIQLDVPGKVVRDAILSEDKDGKLIIAGYYSSKPKSETTGVTFWGKIKFASVNGAFVLALSENGNELKNLYKGIYEFPAEVMKEYESKRTKRKIDKKENDDKAEQENLQLRNFVIGEDGSIQIFGEEYYSTATTYVSSPVGGGMGRGRTEIHHYFNDILALNIDKNGDIKWLKKIPKAQKSATSQMSLGPATSPWGPNIYRFSGPMLEKIRGELSFKEFTYNGNSYLFFFDNEKNLDITPDETPAYHIKGAGGILMAVKIDADGNMQKTEVFDKREEKKKLIPCDFVNINNHEMITRAWGKKGSQIALFSFGK